MNGLGFVLMILAPPILGLVFGLIQLLVYVVLAKAGRITAEQIPFFPILWLRGMLVVVVLGVLLAVLQHLDTAGAV
ncbi:MAG: hypothetical protein H0W78_06640 [Planctomycetes bacterium]|nr:hypothetical protein [Planctomycetota bacterium]